MGNTNDRPPKFLDQLRDLLRRRHYSLETEKKYVYWTRSFIIFNGKKHPSTLPPQAVSNFLSYLARRRHVSPSTQNQALNALVFLYREFLAIDISKLPGFKWAEPRKRIPVVFSRDEVYLILSHLRGDQKLIAALLYGCGLRLAECLRLRRKDLDFERNQIAIWDSKSKTDRSVMLQKIFSETSCRNYHI